MLHCQAPQTMGRDQNFPVSVEVQLLGDNGTGNRPCANPCTPGTLISLNDSVLTEHCPSLSRLTINGADWNVIEVEVQGDSLFRHILNGQVVAEYNHPQLDPEDEDAQKLITGGNLILKGGYIAIQAESFPTEFRKIELVNLETN